jgi:hypothetical protein
LGSLYSICCHLYSNVSNTQRSFIYLAKRRSSQNDAQFLVALTGDARVVKPAEEDDVMLPQCHSRKDILKGTREWNQSTGNRTCVRSAPMGELSSQSGPMSGS